MALGPDNDDCSPGRASIAFSRTVVTEGSPWMMALEVDVGRRLSQGQVVLEGVSGDGLIFEHGRARGRRSSSIKGVLRSALSAWRTRS